MASGTVSVYAITNSREVPPIAGRRLRTVRVGTLTALVADARGAQAATPAALRRYHDTIAAIAAALPAVLPARFGTVMTEAELAVVLHLRAASLRAALKQVSGRVQMTIRIPVGRTLSGPPREPDQARATSGTAHLKMAAARHRDVPGFAPIRTALASWIKDERVERKGDVTSVYHLVPRRSAGVYARAAAQVLSATGLRAVISGPFPAYAFTTF